MAYATPKITFSRAFLAIIAFSAIVAPAFAQDAQFTPLPDVEFETPVVLERDYTPMETRTVLPLFGFAELGVEERTLPNTFTNFDVWNNAETRQPLELGGGTAYRASVAGARVKLRF